MELFEHVAPGDHHRIGAGGGVLRKNGARVGVGVHFFPHVAAPPDEILRQGEARKLAVEEILQGPCRAGGFQPLKAGVRVPAGDRVHRYAGSGHIQEFFHGAEGDFHRHAGERRARRLRGAERAAGFSAFAVGGDKRPLEGGGFLCADDLKGHVPQAQKRECSQRQQADGSEHEADAPAAVKPAGARAEKCHGISSPFVKIHLKCPE